MTTPAGTATSAASFAVAPRIASFSPSSGSGGTKVTINGANFAGVTSVAFNGTAASIAASTPTKITATVPAGATSGKISVTTPAGNAISAAAFSIKATIASFTPDHGGPGAAVTITGSAFTEATKVTFNGIAAAFHVDSDTRITATVPANATTGPLRVVTPAGTATSATSFAAAPRITSFKPAHGAAGATVTITGANFTGATRVAFNGAAASYVVNSAAKITATVPAGASTGTIAVTTAGGTGTSAGTFAIP